MNHSFYFSDDYTDKQDAKYGLKLFTIGADDEYRLLLV